MKNKKVLLECILIVILGIICVNMWRKYVTEWPLAKDAAVCKELQGTEEDSPLLQAADLGCLEALRTLEEGSTTEAVTNKLTKFLAASITGDVKTVRKMLRKGVSANALNSDPFGYACRRGHLDVVKEFIRAGADVNAQEGWPLVAAAEKGHLPVVQELIKAGAKVNIEYGKYKRTPLDFAIHSEHIEVVKELLKAGADVNFSPKADNLQVAVETGNLDLVKELIKAGAKVNAGTEQHPFYTAWAVATGLDEKEIVAELERAGARGSRDQRSYALGYAATKGNVELIKKLLKAGADVNGIGELPPLFWAIDGEGNLAVVNELIKAGADVNKRIGSPETNLTVLHAAAFNGNMEIVTALVKAGADTRVRTDQGKTPRMMAAQQNHPEVAAMLREAEKTQKK